MAAGQPPAAHSGERAADRNPDLDGGQEPLGFVAEGLGQPESAAGILVAALSVGSAVTLLMFVPLRRRRLTRLSATIGVLIQAIGLLITALAGDLAVASLGVWLVGAGFSFTFNELTGSLQERIPDTLRGRIMSYHQIAFIGVRPFVAIAVGTLAAIVTAQAASLAGIVLAPVGLLGIRSAWRWLGGAPRNRRSATGPPQAPASDAEPIALPAAVDPD